MIRRILLIALSIAVLTGGIVGWKVHQHATSPGASYVVALGDSVTAGDGLPVDNSDDSRAAACGRSRQAYPNGVATLVGAQLKSFACSGAQVTAGLLQPQTVSGQALPSQLEAANAYLKGNDVVLTIGANDVDWDTLLTHCAQSDCTGPDDLATYEAKLAQLRPNLATALQKIRAAHPHRIVLNTYYSLLRSGDTCFAADGITPAKIDWANAREAELNNTLRTVAKENGVMVVTIDFRGHLLCDPVPWIQSIFEAAPLHPNQAGQAYIAQQDSRVLR